MNEVVRYVKAGTLPAELRGGFDPDRVVRVAVRREDAPPDVVGDAPPEPLRSRRVDLRPMLDPTRPELSEAEAMALIAAYQQRLRENPSLIETDPVGRVRDARDGSD